ncbi:MAG: hypothetical protein G01um10143_77 [Parcubacteria group bacterium Gr01-1014_3]|nr:MAG: hypothetical protein G01um10143_77 [Parcubacteria group bacterium Gr01-1014_3]
MRPTKLCQVICTILTELQSAERSKDAQELVDRIQNRFESYNVRSIIWGLIGDGLVTLKEKKISKSKSVFIPKCENCGKPH